MKRILQKLNLDVGDLAVEDAILRAERAYRRGGTEILQFEKYNIFDYMQNDIARMRCLICCSPIHRRSACLSSRHWQKRLRNTCAQADTSTNPAVSSLMGRCKA